MKFMEKIKPKQLRFNIWRRVNYELLQLTTSGQKQHLQTSSYFSIRNLTLKMRESKNIKTLNSRFALPNTIQTKSALIQLRFS